MGMSRRAKRGIAVFNKIQSSPSRQKYHTSKMMIKLGPTIEPNIFRAALSAAEAINARIQVVPKSEGYTVTTDTEGGSQQRIPVQPQDSEKATEGTPGGPQ